MDPDTIIFYGDLFFNHIIYNLSVHEVLNLLFVNKKFYKLILNRIMDQLAWKIKKFKGIDYKIIKQTLTKKGTIMTGNLVMSCIYDICSKNKITIMNVETYNPWKKGFNNSKYEDYEQHKFEKLFLKIQCEHKWQYDEIEKVFNNNNKFNTPMSILHMELWIDRYGCIEGPALVMDKKITIHNLNYNHQFDSKYSEYNFLSINKDHSYLKNLQESELYPEFDHFIRCIKKYDFKIFEVKQLQYYPNQSTGRLDDIICSLVHKDDICTKKFGKKLYKSGVINGDIVKLCRSELCESHNCPLRRYGEITNKHYHFFENKYDGNYAEYIFVVN